MLLAALATLATVHLEGDIASVAGDTGDYADTTFTVPAGTVEIHIAHAVTGGGPSLDWGVWSPSGNRGYSGGLADDIVIGVAQSSRGYLPGAIEPGTWTLSIGKPQRAAASEHYTADITFLADATLPVEPRAAYQAVVLATGRRWYRGDFHVHSIQSSDAAATLQQDVDLARARGLDFINLSDHNTVAQHGLVAAHQASWPVLVLRGDEITTYSGHANAVGLRDYVDHRLGLRGRTIAGVIGDVVAQGAAVIINHPATELPSCLGCAWGHRDDTPWDQVAGLEILTAGYGYGERAFTPNAIALWDALEDAGHRLSAIGGSDDHTAGVGADDFVGSAIGSPTALVLADELSEAGILDAIRHQRTAVKLRGPDDPDLELTARTSGGATVDVGGDVDGVSRVELPVRVAGGAGMFVQIWRDGAQVAMVAVTGDDFTTTIEDVPGAGDHRYRAELIEANRRIAVTSHIYVHAVAPPAGGCAAASTSAPGSSPAAAILPLAVLWLTVGRRRRRSALAPGVRATARCPACG